MNTEQSSLDDGLACLSLEHMGLTCLEGMYAHPGVQCLGLLGNQRLCNFYGMPSFPSLIVLDVRQCGITTFAGAARQPVLETLLLAGSPLSLHPRVGVMALLAFGPTLTSIDGVAVSAEDRAAADKLGGCDGYPAMCVALGLTSLASNGAPDGAEHFHKLFEQLKHGFLSYARHHVDRRHSFEAVMLRLGAAAACAASTKCSNALITKGLPSPRWYTVPRPSAQPMPAPPLPPPTAADLENGKLRRPPTTTGGERHPPYGAAHEALMHSVLCRKWAAVQQSHREMVGAHDASRSAPERQSGSSARDAVTGAATSPTTVRRSGSGTLSTFRGAPSKLTRDAALHATRGTGGGSWVGCQGSRHGGEDTAAHAVPTCGWSGAATSVPPASETATSATAQRPLTPPPPAALRAVGTVNSGTTATVQFDSVCVSYGGVGAPRWSKGATLQLCWSTRTLRIDMAAGSPYWALCAQDVEDVVLVDAAAPHGAFVELRVKATSDAALRCRMLGGDVEGGHMPVLRVQLLRASGVPIGHTTEHMFFLLLAWRCNNDAELRTLYASPLPP